MPTQTAAAARAYEAAAYHADHAAFGERRADLATYPGAARDAARYAEQHAAAAATAAGRARDAAAAAATPRAAASARSARSAATQARGSARYADRAATAYAAREG
jgi:hypothetical protein